MQNLICCTLYYKDTGHNKYLIVSSRLVRCSPHSCSVERSHAAVIRLVHVRDVHLQTLLPPLYLRTPLLHPQPLVQHPVLGFLTPSHHYHIGCLKLSRKLKLEEGIDIQHLHYSVWLDMHLQSIHHI